MRTHPFVAALLLGAGLTFAACNSQPDTDAHEQEAHATPPKPAQVAALPRACEQLI